MAPGRDRRASGGALYEPPPGDAAQGWVTPTPSVPCTRARGSASASIALLHRALLGGGQLVVGREAAALAQLSTSSKASLKASSISSARSGSLASTSGASAS